MLFERATDRSAACPAAAALPLLLAAAVLQLLLSLPHVPCICWATGPLFTAVGLASSGYFLKQQASCHQNNILPEFGTCMLYAPAVVFTQNVLRLRGQRIACRTFDSCDLSLRSDDKFWVGRLTARWTLRLQAAWEPICARRPTHSTSSSATSRRCGALICRLFPWLPWLALGLKQARETMSC